MKVHINGKIFDSEVLETPDELQRGMMGRDSLNGCMVFKMGMGNHSFWMKDCLIPLDIVYVIKNRISKIHSNCQPCDDCDERFRGIGDHVMEFPAGTTDGWKVGDRVYMGTKFEKEV
jgi:uncharacterized protein